MKERNAGMFKSGASHVNYKHGHTTGQKRASPTYSTWVAMMGRCYRPSSGNFKQYGGRGIKVCERWHQFENFFEDLGERPKRKSIERKDSNADYSKDNCVWATAKEQSRNLSNNVYLTIGEDRKLLVEWCEIYGRSYQMVHQRIFKRGWPAAKALETPSKK